MPEEKFVITPFVDLKQFTNAMTEMATRMQGLQKEVAAGGGVGLSQKQIQAITQLGDIASKSNLKVKGTIGDVAVQMQKAGDGAQNLGRQLLFADSNLALVGKRVFLWGSATAAIFGAIMKIKEAVQYTRQLDAEMVELKKVLPRPEDFEIFKPKTFELGRMFGIDPVEVAKVFRTYAQAGLETNEILEATRATLLGVNTTGATVQEMVNGLVSAVKNFNLAWSESYSIVDKVMRLQADYVVESRDLIQALTILGPAVKIFAGGMDELFGAITAVAEVTRTSGTEIANAFKFMLVRIPRPETESVLARYGIYIRDATGELRPLRHILNDVAKSWDTMSNANKNALGFALAGARQFPKIVALFNNWGVATEAMNKSLFAFGDALKANDIQMESINKRFASMVVSFKELAVTFAEAGLIDILKQIMFVAMKVVEAIESLGPTFIGTATKIGAAVLIFKILGFTFKDLTAGMFRSMAASQALSLGLKGEAATAYVASAANNKLIITLNQLGITAKATGIGISKAFGWIGIIATLLAIALPWEKWLGSGREEMEKAGLEAEYLKSRLNELKDVKIKGIADEDYVGKIKKLVEATNKYYETHKDGKIVLKDIETIFSSSGIVVDKLSESFKTQDDLVRALATSYGFLTYMITKEEEFKKLNKAIDEVSKNLDKITEKREIKLGVLKIEPIKGAEWTGAIQQSYGNIIDNINEAKLSQDVFIRGTGILLENLKFAKEQMGPPIVEDWEKFFEVFKIDPTTGLLKNIGNLSDMLNQNDVVTKKWAQSIFEAAVQIYGLSDAFISSNEVLKKYGEKHGKVIVAFSQLQNQLRQIGLEAQARALDPYIQNLKKMAEGVKDTAIEGSKLPIVLRLSELAAANLMSAIEALNKEFEKELALTKRIGELSEKAGFSYDAEEQELRKLETQITAIINLRGRYQKTLETEIDNRDRLTQQLKDAEEESFGIEQIATWERELGVSNKKIAELTKSIAQFDDEMSRGVGIAEGVVDNFKRQSVLKLSLYKKEFNALGMIYDYQSRLLDLEKDRLVAAGFKPTGLLDIEKQMIELEYEEQKAKILISKETKAIKDEMIKELDFQKALNLAYADQYVQMQNIIEYYEQVRDITGDIRGTTVDWLSDTDQLLENLSDVASLKKIFADFFGPLSKELQRRWLEMAVKVVIPEDFGAKFAPPIVDASLKGSKIFGDGLDISFVDGTQKVSGGIERAFDYGAQKVYDNITRAFSVATGTTLGGLTPSAIPVTPKSLLSVIPKVYVGKIEEKAAGGISDEKMTRAKAWATLAAPYAGALAGYGMAKLTGKTPEYVTTGASMGMMAATFAKTGFLAEPGGMIAGAAIGGLLGAMLGGKEKREEKVAQNIQEISENTGRLVDLLSPSMFNVPPSFTIPKGTMYGGPREVNMSFSIQSSTPKGVADEVYKIVSDNFYKDYNRTGQRARTIK